MRGIACGLLGLALVAAACGVEATEERGPGVSYATATPGAPGVVPMVVRDGPVPTATPTATATPTPELRVPVGGTLSEPAARHVLTVAGWPEELHDEALAVMWCESGWQPWAVGDDGRALGLFQLWPVWWRYAGADRRVYADPVLNAAVALEVYRYEAARGYAPWSNWSCKP